MRKKSQLFDPELERVRGLIAAEVDALAQAKQAVQQHEKKLVHLRRYEASVINANNVTDQSRTPSAKERYDNAELLFEVTLLKRPLTKALRQLFEDSAPDEYDRETIVTLVRGVDRDAKESTIYSSLSRLVGEGVVEKTATGYRGKPKL